MNKTRIFKCPNGHSSPIKILQEQSLPVGNLKELKTRFVCCTCSAEFEQRLWVVSIPGGFAVWRTEASFEQIAPEPRAYTGFIFADTETTE